MPRAAAVSSLSLVGAALGFEAQILKWWELGLH
jgi:hypothetical protein